MVDNLETWQGHINQRDSMIDAWLGAMKHDPEQTMALAKFLVDDTQTDEVPVKLIYHQREAARILELLNGENLEEWR